MAVLTQHQPQRRTDPPAEAPLVCAECGRPPRDDENPADEWRACRDVDDDLPVFCPECAEREFGD